MTSDQIGQDASRRLEQHDTATESGPSTSNPNGTRLQQRAIAKRPLLPSNDATAIQAASDDVHEAIGGLKEVNRADNGSTQGKSTVADTAPAVMVAINQARGDTAPRANEQLLKRKPNTDAGSPYPKISSLLPRTV